MLTYIIHRLVVTFVLILAVGSLSQIAIHLIPGDPAYLILGGEMAPDPEQLESIWHALGLDRPILMQVITSTPFCSAW